MSLTIAVSICFALLIFIGIWAGFSLRRLSNAINLESEAREASILKIESDKEALEKELKTLSNGVSKLCVEVRESNKAQNKETERKLQEMFKTSLNHHTALILAKLEPLTKQVDRNTEMLMQRPNE